MKEFYNLFESLIKLYSQLRTMCEYFTLKKNFKEFGVNFNYYFFISIVGYYYTHRRPPWCVGRFTSMNAFSGFKRRYIS